MKTIYTYLTVALILVATNYISAQNHPVKYLNKSGLREVNKEEAHFFVIEEKTDSWGGTRTRYKMDDSTKVMLLTYSNLIGGLHGDGVLEGPHYEWYGNGKLKVQSVYVKNELHGEERGWYESGALHYKKTYKNYKLADTLTAYYESGKVRRLEVYADNKLVKGTLYDEDGKELKFFPMLQMPEFPGGELKFQKYLAKSIRYPGSAAKQGVSGLVVVSFIVDVDGAIRDLEVIKNVHEDLDAEAVRVLASMPAWEPGKHEGKATAIRFTIPVRFSMM